MLSKEALIEKLAPHYQAFLKTRTSEFTAWTATLSQFDDLKYLLKPEEDFAKKKLLGEIKKFIKEKEQREKEQLTKTNEPQTTEVKKMQPIADVRHWANIENGIPEEAEPKDMPLKKILPDEPDEIIHEPDPHSESFLDDENEMQYISRIALRKELKEDHRKDINERTGLSEDARKELAKRAQPKMR